MSKYCSDCSYIDTSKVKPGKVSGNLYYCKKLKEYVNPSMCGCEKFDKTYSRKSYENDEIYQDGKDYYNNDTPLGLLIGIFIFLVILGLFMGVF